MATSVKATVTV